MHVMFNLGTVRLFVDKVMALIRAKNKNKQKTDKHLVTSDLVITFGGSVHT